MGPATVRVLTPAIYICRVPIVRNRRPSAQTRAVLDSLVGDRERWRHGYEISKETGLASGTLYPLLLRLADRGYLESKWEESDAPGRPPRHLYRLTSAGRQYAVDASRTVIAARAVPDGA
jgi:PadR family transcriptional regulator